MAYRRRVSAKATMGQAVPAAPEVPAWLTLQWCRDRYEEWYTETSDERKEALTDVAYYHGDQWSPDELEEIKKRGQPPLVKNRIARKIDTVAGDEAEKGVDPYCKPRTPADEDDARAMTDAVRFVADEAGLDAVDRAVFFDMITAGIGGAIIGGDGSPDGITAPTTHVPYDLLWWDVASRLPDFSDGKYCGVAKWFDVEDAVADYHDAAKTIERAVGDARGLRDAHEDKPLWVDSNRKRVCVVEIYVQVGDECFKACFVRDAFVLDPAPTGDLNEDGHHIRPLEMVACKTNTVTDDRVTHYGLIRNMRSPQDEVNKRSSKALHLLTVKQVLREQNAIPDPHNFQEELAKPDGDLVVTDNALRDQKVQIISGADLASAQIGLLQDAKNEIDNIGPQAANLPELPTSASGIALETRTKAASRELAPVGYAMKDWRKRVYCQYIWRIKQFRQDEWWMRVTDDEELTGYRFSALNRQMTRAQRFKELLEKEAPLESAMAAAAGELSLVIMREASAGLKQRLAMMVPAQQIPPEQQEKLVADAIARHPLMLQPITVNQAAKANIDLIVDETPDTGTIAERQFTELVKMQPALQNSGVQIPAELWIEASSLPNKRKLRQLVADAKKPDPQAQQLQQQVAQLQMALQQATVQLTLAQAKSAESTAAKNMADVQVKQAGNAETAADVAKKQAETVKIQVETEQLAQPQVAVLMPGGPNASSPFPR